MIIIFTLLLGVLAYNFSKQIRKHYKLLLGLVSIFSVVGYIVGIELVTLGFLGLAFLLVVMFAGAFKKDGKLSKRLRSVRKEYSIFGVIILIPHAVTYLIEFLAGTFTWEWFGIIAMILMIPLFITSFTFIRKKMSNKTWKNLQKLAYIAYALTFIHLIIVSSGANLIQYVLVFGFYLILKVWNYIFKTEQGLAKGLVTGCIIVMMFMVSKDTLTTLDLTSSTNTEGVNVSEVILEDGIYSGSSTGFQSLPVEVSVTILNGEIVDIVILEDGATSPHRGVDFEAAVYQLAEDIIENQSTNLDTVSGATKSTDGLLDAVEAALNDALID